MILFINITACSTIVSKTHDDNQKNSQLGHPYSGVHESIENSPCIIYASASLGPLFPVGIIVMAPFQVLDIGLSLAADTIMLPIDIYIDPIEEDRNRYFSCH